MLFRIPRLFKDCWLIRVPPLILSLLYHLFGDLSRGFFILRDSRARLGFSTLPRARHFWTAHSLWLGEERFCPPLLILYYHI